MSIAVIPIPILAPGAVCCKITEGVHDQLDAGSGVCGEDQIELIGSALKNRKVFGLMSFTLELDSWDGEESEWGLPYRLLVRSRATASMRDLAYICTGVKGLPCRKSLATKGVPTVVPP